MTILSIHPSSPLPIFAQIMHGMKELILQEHLKPGEMIPSVRALAQDLKVNPNTVARAYRELEREKWIEARRGEGVHQGKTEKPGRRNPEPEKSGPYKPGYH